MKTSHYKVIGIGLLAAAVLTAIAWQFLANGLVGALPPPSPRVISVNGLDITQTSGAILVYHVYRIVAFGFVALLGLACIIRSGSHEPNA